MIREEAKAYIIQHCNPNYPNGNTEWEIAMNMAIEALQQPEIIRCKDCKRCQIEILCNDYWCDGKKVWEDHYCGYAERMQV